MNKFLVKLEQLLNNNDIENVKKHIEESLTEAIKDNDTDNIILILNEGIGFYRDMGEYGDSLKLSNSLLKLLDHVKDNKTIFISYINIANSFRVNNMFNESLKIFDEGLKIYVENNLDLKIELSALYNNKGLLLLNNERYLDAINCFNESLELLNDEKIKIATCYINIANCHLKLNNLKYTKAYLDKAYTIFKDHLDDFHIMGYYSLNAKYLYLTKDFINSKIEYEKALAHINKFTGINNDNYLSTLSEYENILKLLIEKRIPLLEESENYFNEYKGILFDGISEEDKKNITVCLIGLGSECYKCDDFISEDHDFQIGFQVVLEDNVEAEVFKKLEKNYNLLPKIYKRFFVRNVLPKHGVHYYSEFIKEYLGINNGAIEPNSISLLTNGRLFYYYKSSSLYKLRIEQIENKKKYFNIDISLKALEISQYVPYNLKRALDRSDLETYSLLKNHLIDKLIEFYYLVKCEFLMHDKLSLKKMDKDNDIYKIIIKMLKNEDFNLYDDINSIIVKYLFDLFIIHKVDSIYIDDYREYLIKFINDEYIKLGLVEKIIELEWNEFQELKNIDGRAECQNNYDYFVLMRKSQFYTWSLELIKSYYNDLINSNKFNYNVLAIKYGFMEETVDPDHYKLIKNNLPKITKKQADLIEGIVNVQLEMLDEFSKNNYNDFLNMRDRSQKSDNIHNASYETYLRGELKSYSENTLYLYAKNLTDFARSGQNIVKNTIDITKRLFK